MTSTTSAKGEKAPRGSGHGKENGHESAEPRNAKVRFRSTMQRDEVISYFEAVLAGLKDGRLQLRQGDRNVTLDVPPFVDLEVKATAKGNKGSLAFDVSWDDGEGAALTISSS